MTEMDWIRLLIEDPVAHLPIAADWLEEHNDPAYGLLRWLCSRIDKVEDVWDPKRPIGPRISPPPTNTSWWLVSVNSSDGPDNLLPTSFGDYTEDGILVDFKTPEQAWSWALKVWRLAKRDGKVLPI